MLKIALCDDVQEDLELINQAIHLWSKHKDVQVNIFVYHNGDELLNHYRHDDVDIIFLDIVMPLFNGMEVAYEIRTNDQATKIIFLTSSLEYAIESYDVKASGYLVKPVNVKKLFTLLDDCYKELYKEDEYMIIKDLHGYQKVYLHEIEYLEAQNKKVLFHLNNGDIIETQESLSQYVEKLGENQGFFKCHRSYLIGMNNVDYFNNTEIYTKQKKRIPIARGFGKSFKEAYFNFMFKGY